MLGFRAIALTLIAAPVWAGDTALTGEKFGGFVDGKTFAYARGGRVFGTEVYLPGNSLYWVGADGNCLAGVWFAQDAKICFVYEVDVSGEPRVCAPIFAMGAGLRAEEASGAVVIGVPAARPDLSACPGPKVGS